VPPFFQADTFNQTEDHTTLICIYEWIYQHITQLSWIRLALYHWKAMHLSLVWLGLD